MRDGTVGATKNTVKIIGENTPLYAQGYFVYDSKKSGAITVSHLRFGPEPIDSTYLIRRADFVACHQFEFMEKLDVLELARQGATFLLNSPYGPDEVWGKLPREAQQTIIDRRLKFFVVDALAVAKQAGLAGRINTVTQACFFAISGVLPRDEAIAKIKEAIRKTYGKRGETVLARNFAAVDASLAAMAEVKVPKRADSLLSRRPIVPKVAPDFVQRVTAMMLDGKGDLLPVSALPVDGTFPTGTTQWEKRSIAQEIPIWDENLCTQCAICPLICPHAAIRMTVFSPEEMKRAPATFKAVPWARKDSLEGMMYALQVAPEDCTGCGACVDVCPTRSKTRGQTQGDQPGAKTRAPRSRARQLRVLPQPAGSAPVVRQDRRTARFAAAAAAVRVLRRLLRLRRDALPEAAVAALRRPPGGRQRHRLLIDLRRQSADDAVFEKRRRTGARPGPTACSKTTPNSGLACGSRSMHSRNWRRCWCVSCAMRSGRELAEALLAAPQGNDEQIREQRARVRQLKQILNKSKTPEAARLLAVADYLVTRSVWIVGGDGWAYDIGYGGLDHVLASGRNVNILVLDTEVYSNTGGQASKSTPRGAVAKFAAAGKATRQEGPRHDRDGLRQRLRRAGGDGCESGAHGAHVPGSRGVERPVADHRLQPLHRARHRHDDRHSATSATLSRAGT